MLTIIAEIQIRSGAKHYKNVCHAFKKITPIVLLEKGCYGYELLTDYLTEVDFQTKVPDSITLLEHWESMQHLNAHLKTAHMQAYQAEVEDDVVGIKIRILAAA